MRLQLGLVSFDLPDDTSLSPAMMLLAGKTDEQAALAAGPTLAKTQSHSYQRTVAMSFSAFPKDADPDEALNFGLNELQKKTAGKVSNVKDEKVADCPARSVEFRYQQQTTRTPVVTRAYLVLTTGWLLSFVLTALDHPKTTPAAFGEFDKLVRSIQLGS